MSEQNLKNTRPEPPAVRCAGNEELREAVDALLDEMGDDFSNGHDIQEAHMKLAVLVGHPSVPFLKAPQPAPATGTEANCKNCGDGERRLWCGAGRPYPAENQARAEKSDAGGCGLDFNGPWWRDAYRCGDCGYWFHKDCLAAHLKATGCDLTAPKAAPTGTEDKP